MSQCDSAHREHVCPESHVGNLAYVPKPPNTPSTSQQVHDIGDCDAHMHDAIAEEEKVMLQKCESNQKDARAKPR